MSRQRKWQKEMRAANRCIICGAKAAKSKRKGTGGFSGYCPEHKAKHRALNIRRLVKLK